MRIGQTQQNTSDNLRELMNSMITIRSTISNKTYDLIQLTEKIDSSERDPMHLQIEKQNEF